MHVARVSRSRRVFSRSHVIRIGLGFRALGFRVLVLPWLVGAWYTPASMSLPLALSSADYLALPRAQESWLVQSVVPVGGSVLIYGAEKMGKTYAGLQLALAVATGDDWLGFRTRQSGRVLYVQLDTPANLWANDPEQYLKRLELMGILPNPNLFLADRETLDCWPFNILDTGHAGRLRAAVESVQPLMVVIDTLREAHRGDENASDDMQGAISGLVAACRPAAVLLVHHSKKPNHEQGRDTRSDMRGGYIAGRMDTVFQLGKGQLHFFGRALEDGSMKIDRQESGLWLPVHDGIEESIRGIFGADPTLPIREAARRLAASTGRSEDACRGLIRRHRPQEVEVG